MALKKNRRCRAPLDGSWFRISATLTRVLRYAKGYEDIEFPSGSNAIEVPVWVSMRPYQAMETPDNPSGTAYGPVVKIGSMDSPEMELFGHHHAAGLFMDYSLDWESGRKGLWIYRPLPEDAYAPGEDVSTYRCDQCDHDLYRDDDRTRSGHAAWIQDGSLVCRDCDADGLVYLADVAEQLAAARRLADRVGPECRKRLDRDIEILGEGFAATGHRSVTRLYRDGRYSFSWGSYVRTDAGEMRAQMSGGLIQHGPYAEEIGGVFLFKEYDYNEKRWRPATEDEVSRIRWSIHT